MSWVIVEEAGMHLECDLCSSVFGFKETLRAHMVTAHMVEAHKVKCDLCSQLFISKVKLRAHMVAAHLINARFKCGKCPYANKYLSKVRAHWKFLHTGHPVISTLRDTCTVCSRTLGSRRDLLRHIARRHSDLLQCPRCVDREIFVSTEDLKIHFLTSHGRSSWQNHQLSKFRHINEQVSKMKKNPETSETGEVKSERTEVSPEVEVVDFVESPYGAEIPNSDEEDKDYGVENSACDCEICKELATNDQKQRVRAVHGDLNHRFQCAICEYKTYNIRQVKCHFSKVHVPVTSTRTIKCQLCGLVCKSDYKLKLHKIKTHTEVLRCTQCGQFYAGMLLLRRHFIRCHGEAKFKQYLVNRIFEMESTVDAMSAPLKCHICTDGKLFNSKIKLTNHLMMVHLEIKILVCLSCDFRSRLLPLMHKHLMQRHFTVFRKTLKRDRFGGWEPEFFTSSLESQIQEHSSAMAEIIDNSRASQSEEVFENSESRSANLPKRIPAESTETYFCYSCQIGFANCDMLKNHIFRAHSSVFHCPCCENQTCQNFTDLGKHFTAMHNGESWEKHEDVITREVNEKILHVLSDPASFQCLICYDTFSLHKSTEVHILRKHFRIPRIEIKCDLCDFITLHGSELKTHVGAEHADYTKLTGSRVSDTREPHILGPTELATSLIPGTTLALENASGEDVKLLFICEVCEIGFLTVEDLKCHISRMENPKIHCPFCKNKAFSKIQSLREHFTLKHATGSWSFYLQEIRVELDEKINHVIADPATGLFKCVLCTRLATDKKYLRQHVQSIHLFSLKDVCKICSYAVCVCSSNDLRIDEANPPHTLSDTFPTNPTIQEPIDEVEHVQSMASTSLLDSEEPSTRTEESQDVGEVQNYMCICRKEFSDEISLTSHIESSHLDVSLPYFCQLCQKFFSHTFSMESHWYTTHGETEPQYSRMPPQDTIQPTCVLTKFPCIFCNTYFKTTIELNSHMVTHPSFYRCSICEFATRYHDALMCHVKIKHFSRALIRPSPISATPDMSRLDQQTPGISNVDLEGDLGNSVPPKDSPVSSHQDPNPASTSERSSTDLGIIELEPTDGEALHYPENQETSEIFKEENLAEDFFIKEEPIEVEVSEDFSDGESVSSGIGALQSEILDSCVSDLRFLNRSAPENTNPNRGLKEIDELSNTNFVGLSEASNTQNKDNRQIPNTEQFFNGSEFNDSSTLEFMNQAARNDLQQDTRIPGLRVHETPTSKSGFPAPRFVSQYELEAKEEAQVQSELLKIHNSVRVPKLGFRCHLCSKYACSNKCKLVWHVLVSHLRIEQYRCQHCNVKFFAKKGAVAHHKKLHAGLPLSCVRRFNWDQSLKIALGNPETVRASEEPPQRVLRGADKVSRPVRKTHSAHKGVGMHQACVETQETLHRGVERSKRVVGSSRELQRVVGTDQASAEPPSVVLEAAGSGKNRVGIARGSLRSYKEQEDPQVIDPRGEISGGPARKSSPDHNHAQQPEPSCTSPLTYQPALHTETSGSPDLLAVSGAQGRRVTSRPYPDSLPPVPGGCLPCSVQL